MPHLHLPVCWPTAPERKSNRSILCPLSTRWGCSLDVSRSRRRRRRRKRRSSRSRSMISVSVSVWVRLSVRVPVSVSSSMTFRVSASCPYMWIRMRLFDVIHISRHYACLSTNAGWSDWRTHCHRTRYRAHPLRESWETLSRVLSVVWAMRIFFSQFSKHCQTDVTTMQQAYATLRTYTRAHMSVI